MTTRINQFNISNTATPVVASLTATGNIVANAFLYANGAPVTTGGGSESSSTPNNVYFLQGTTSNNTETELFVDGELGNQITVPVDSSMYYTIDVTCRRTNGSDFAAFTLKSVVSNSGNTVSDVGAVYEIVVARTDASISVDARADDANNSIGVYVTGVTGKSFTWKAQVTVVEV
jgi:hypothetical protein